MKSMNYHQKINQAIIEQWDQLRMINDGDLEARTDLVAYIIERALENNEALYKLAADYIENAIDLSLRLEANFR